MAHEEQGNNRLIEMLIQELKLADEAALREASDSGESSRQGNLEDRLHASGILDAKNRNLLARIRDKSVALSGSLRESATDRGSRTTPVAANDSPRDKARELSNRFEVISHLDRGGLGTVSIAEDREFHRRVAIKQMLHESEPTSLDERRFLFEARVTGRLEHPGIVPVYSLGTDSQNRPYYAMRLIQGQSMKAAIAAHFSNAKATDAKAFHSHVRTVVGQLVDVCNAIEYAHSRGVVHRDLKPSNIMLGDYGETLVVDWGLAKLHQRDMFHDEEADKELDGVKTGSAEDLTGVDAILGTLEYLSPEQLEPHSEAIGPHTDIFLLGATLYCALTGRGLYPRDGDAVSQREAIRHARFPAPRALNPRIPRSLEAICLKACAANPDLRYASARAMADDLNLWLADETVAAYTDSARERFNRLLKRHRTGLFYASVMLAALSVALVAFSGMLQQKNSQLVTARNNLQSEAQNSRNAALELIKLFEELEETLRERPTYAWFDRLESAIGSLETARQSLPADKELAEGHANILLLAAKFHRYENDYSASRGYFERVKALLDSLIAEGYFKEEDARFRLAEYQVARAALERAMGHYAEAIELLKQSSQTLDDLLRLNSQREEYLREKATAEMEMASLHWALGNHDTVETHARLARDLFRILSRKAEPHRLMDRMNLIRSYNLEARMQLHRGEFQSAADTLEGALYWVRTVEEERDINLGFAIAETYCLLAQARSRLDGDPDTLEDQLTDIESMTSHYSRKSKGVEEFQYILAECYRTRAVLALARQHAEEDAPGDVAINHLKQAQEALRVLRGPRFNNPRFAAVLIQINRQLIELIDNASDQESLQNEIDQVLREVAEDFPEFRDF